MNKNANEHDPEGGGVVLSLCLVGVSPFFVIGDFLREMVDFHLGGKQDHDKAAAGACNGRNRQCKVEVMTHTIISRVEGAESAGGECKERSLILIGIHLKEIGHV